MTYSNIADTPGTLRETFQRAIAKARADAVDSVREVIIVRDNTTIVIPPGMEIGTLSADGEFVLHVPGKSPTPTHARWKEAL